MTSSLAVEFVKNFGESIDRTKGVTTTLDPDSMRIVERWRGRKSIKAAVGNLLKIADEALEEAKRSASMREK